MIGIDPKFVRDPSDGGDGWGDNPDTPDVDESANDDYGDLRLTTHSPAIDYGNDAAAVDTDGNPLSTDLDGNPRFYNGSPVDVGAVEFQGEPAAGRQAASLMVTTSEDVFDLYDNLVSLREAIYYVGTGSLGDTITFDPTLDEETIRLSGTSVWIDRGLTIDASGLTSLTIDADQQSRVFTVIAPEADPVELKHLTITGGLGDCGGGIYSIRSTLTVSTSMLSGNSANDDGGGIYNYDGTLTVTNSIISGNSAGGSGGGICNCSGTLTVTNSTIMENAAEEHGGGGICNTGTLTVTNSTLSGNSAGTVGGGICNMFGMLTVTNSTLSGNSADYASGISNEHGTLAVTNSTLSGNSTGNGGVISSSGDTPTLNNSILWQNGSEELDGFETLSGSRNLIGIDPKFVRDSSDGGDGWGDNPNTPDVDESANDDYGDLRLTAHSPAIDYGDDSLAVDADENPLSTDLDGNPRFFSGSPVDVGAVEYQGEPAAGRQAASLMVTTSEDVFDLYDNLVSLREAIYYVGTGSLGDTITFDPTLDEETIRLSGVSLWIDRGLTIDASGLTSLTIDADGQSRAFTVIAPEADPVELKYLTITGGLGNYGGGICNISSTLAVTNSTLAGNSADWGGGGIYNHYGSLTVTNSTLSGNSATEEYSGLGGGIYNYDGTLTVTNSIISGNSTGGSGGGIHNSSGTLTITSSTISNNSAIGAGGIYNDSGTLTVTNSTIMENAADQFAGGGIYNDSHGTLTVTNSTLSGNDAATYGGGIYSRSYSTLTVTNSTLSGNSAGWGGGIYNDYGDTLTVTNSTLSGNLAMYGGGIYNYSGTLTVTNSTFSGNAASSGGGICSNGPLTVNNSILWQNYGGAIGDPGILSGSHNLIGIDPKFVRDPSDGGDGWWDDFDTPDVDESANNDYGDLRLTAHSPAIDYGSDAAAVDADGNPLSTDLDGNPRFFSGSPVDVGAVEYQGEPAAGRQAASLPVTTSEDVFDLYDNLVSLREAIYYVGTGSLEDTITFDPTLDEETIRLCGTSLWIDRRLIIDASVLTSLTIDADQQSRVFTVIAPEADPVELKHLTIAGGLAYQGGGIYNISSTLTVSTSTLSGNSAMEEYFGRGGGIYNYDGTLTVTNSIISGNSAGGSGGGIYNCSGTLTVANSTVSGNSAEYAGGGIFGTLTVNNSIVAQNEASSGPDVCQSGGTLVGSHNLVGDGTDQSGLVDGVDGNQVGTSAAPIDPWFVSPADGNYRLRPESPAIDTGDDALAVDAEGNPLETDLDGNPRISLCHVDIGAYELPPLDHPFAVFDHTPGGSFLVGQEEASLWFTRALTTVSSADLTLHGPLGEIPLREIMRTGYGSGWSVYTVRFDSLAAAGEYEFVVRSTVRDGNGQRLDQDLDGTAGEASEDEYHATWSLPGPKVESCSPTGTLVSWVPLTHFDITFSTAMDTDSFSLDDVEELTGPEGDIEPIGFAWLDDRTVRLSFEPVAAVGTVSLTLGTRITDAWGNALDQNQNAISGEPADTWTGSVTRTVGGTISQDMVIPSTAGELLVDQTITVAEGVTLTIEPGVTLKFSAGAGLTVNGVLVVEGTSDEPVVFTSLQSTPGHSAWSGVCVRSTGSIYLTHAKILHAAKAVDANSTGAYAVLTDTILRDGGYGVYVYSPYAEVIAENCLIADNAQHGVYVRADSRHVFRNCTIVGNAGGIHLGGANLTLDNCIVAYNGNGLDHSGDPPLLTIRNSLFHNPGGQEIIWDGDPGMPDLGADGNMTADPLFVDRGNGDYELSAGSPCIDAGRGIQTTSKDILGRPRYDDQGMPNVGTGYPSFVDIGAFERQTDTFQADLAVDHVSSPEPDALVAGETFELSWTVSNQGTLSSGGPWIDAVYLSADPYFSSDDTEIASVNHVDSLLPGEYYVATVSATVPLGISGARYVLVRTDANRTSADQLRANNIKAAPDPLAIALPCLEVDSPIAGTVTRGEWAYYRFDPLVDQNIVITLDGQSSSGTAGLYASYDTLPTLENYTSAATTSGTDQTIRLLNMPPGTCYIGVNNISSTATLGFTLLASVPDPEVYSVSPGKIGNGGTATLELTGDQFAPDCAVQLRAGDGTLLDGIVTWITSGSLTAQFNLDDSSVTTGFHDVLLTNPGDAPLVVEDSVEILASGQAAFVADLTMPGVCRPGRVITIPVTYTNTGLTDLRSPMLILRGDEDYEWQAPESDDWITTDEFCLLALSSTGAANILRPGQTETIDVKLRTPFRPETVHVGLSSVGVESGAGSDELIDWSRYFLPGSEEADDTSLDELVANLSAECGTSWGSYTESLGEVADIYAAIGERVYSVDALHAILLGNAATSDAAFASGKSPKVEAGVTGKGTDAGADDSEHRADLELWDDAHSTWVVANDSLSLAKSGEPVFIIIHGHNDDNTGWVRLMAMAICHEYSGSVNVLSVEWAEDARPPQFHVTALRIPSVAHEAAEQLVEFYRGSGTTPGATHIIGHSHGAHVAGLLANEVHALYGKIGQLTALDPSEESVHLHWRNLFGTGWGRSSAVYVDVYKSSEIAGGERAWGDDNFLLTNGSPNWFFYQDATSSHSFAHEWYLGTILSDSNGLGFSWNSDSWSDYCSNLGSGITFVDPNAPWKGVINGVTDRFECLDFADGIPLEAGFEFVYPGAWNSFESLRNDMAAAVELEVTVESMPSEWTCNGHGDLSLTVANNADNVSFSESERRVAQRYSWGVSAWLSIDDQFDPNEDMFLNFQISSFLDVGGGRQISFNHVSLPEEAVIRSLGNGDVLLDDYYMIVAVDTSCISGVSTGQWYEGELYTRNNWEAVPIQVQGESLSADAGRDRVVWLRENEEIAWVSLDGSVSGPAENITRYEWTYETDVISHARRFTYPFDEGTHELTLTVYNDNIDPELEPDRYSDTDTVIVQVIGENDPPEGEDEDDGSTNPQTSYTPEDKYGPAGYDPPETPQGDEVRFISDDNALDYCIEFWNKEEALVPTQDAIILDELDPTVFDLSTLEFTRIGFLDWDVELAGGQVIDTRIDCRPEMNIAVEIKAGLGMEVPGFADNEDIDENTIVWWFHCIDPETGEWPDDPMAGFLPPFNPETEFEIGWVDFHVDPVAGLASGTQLSNVAYVEFDFAGDIYDHPAPKVDPDVEPAEPAPWINTIDAGVPTSQIEALPFFTGNEVVTVRWHGQDEEDGSGIASYDVYVSVDEGAWEPWLSDITDTEALFLGEPGHTYAFYSLATDNVGHTEIAPDTLDSQTTVVLQLGDLDNDGYVCGNELEIIHNHWHETVTPGDLHSGDLSGDGFIDEADEAIVMAHWLEGTPPIPGDLNNDGIVGSDGYVGSADLDIVRANWGETVFPTALSRGDASGDGYVGSADLDIIRANWGAVAPSAATAQIAPQDSAATSPQPLYGPRRQSASDAALSSWNNSIPDRDLSDADLASLAEAAWLREIEGLRSKAKRKGVEREGLNQWLLMGK